MANIENIEKMMECLVDKAKTQIESNADNVDTHELGEVIDMVKDLAEAKYKCTIVKAMEEEDEKEELMDKLSEIPMESPRYYGGRRARDSRGRYMYGGNTYDYRMPEYYRDMDMPTRRYYDDLGTYNMVGGRMSNNGSSVQSRGKYEGRSGMSRNRYYDAMEKNDQQMKKNELENYMNELSSDMTEMLSSMDSTDKQNVRAKLQTLANKIV